MGKILRLAGLLLLCAIWANGQDDNRDLTIPSVTGVARCLQCPESNPNCSSPETNPDHLPICATGADSVPPATAKGAPQGKAQMAPGAVSAKTSDPGEGPLVAPLLGAEASGAMPDQRVSANGSAGSAAPPTQPGPAAGAGYSGGEYILPAASARTSSPLESPVQDGAPASPTGKSGPTAPRAERVSATAVLAAWQRGGESTAVQALLQTGALDSRDASGHERVAEDWSRRLGQASGLPPQALERLLASPRHQAYKEHFLKALQARDSGDIDSARVEFAAALTQLLGAPAKPAPLSSWPFRALVAVLTMALILALWRRRGSRGSR